ncbi:MAG: hypothetical protein V3W04_02485 [Gammaproteobacteria bacterium]
MFAWLKYWLSSWLEMCFLKRAPQNDPVSSSAMILAFTLFTPIKYLLAVVTSGSRVALGVMTIDFLIMIAMLLFTLVLTYRTNRLQQSLTAMAGTGVVTGVVALPLVQVMMASLHNDQIPVLIAVAWLLLAVWSVVVRAHIYRHALSVSFIVGVGLAIVHGIIVYSVVEQFYPTAE